MFRFKQFSICQDRAAFKVGTDGVLLGAWAEVAQAQRVLDIGTGSGLIALMLAQRSRSSAAITAIEPHRPSFEQACENVAASCWSGQIELYNCPLQEFFTADSGCFDLIVSNPPYFVNSLKNPDSQKAATRHTDSLSFAELIDGVVRLMLPEGSFQLILPTFEAELLLQEAKRRGLFCNRVLEVLPKIGARCSRMLMSLSFSDSPCQVEQLTIETEQRHCYTDEYVALTRDYYLTM